MKTNMYNGITDEKVKEMQSVDIMTVDINSLADINDVVLNPDLSIQSSINPVFSRHIAY